MVQEHTACWDCGTGNGQLAVLLAEDFGQVYATDISAKQLSNAIKRDNVNYSRQPAEHTYFDNHQFDLITVAQAVHWFDFNAFYREVSRVLKPGGCIVVIGYGLLRIDPQIDPIIDHFYSDIIGPYWDPERRYLDEGYQTIPFPFAEVPAPSFHLKADLSLDQLIGYLQSWSAVQHFREKSGADPVDQIKDRLSASWDHPTRQITHPLFVRVGRRA